MRALITLVTLIILTVTLTAQTNNDNLTEKINNKFENLGHRLDRLEKITDDILWFQRVGDVAFIDKVRMTGPPKWKEENPNQFGAGAPFKFWSYVFIPKDIDFSAKYPLIVFPHGGVHADFTTYYTHIVRELVAQGYIVVAAEYRGSTGYGKGHYESIDYGGLEVEDVDASREYMITNYKFVDPDRIGIMGWSHGGLITLHNVFRYPSHYDVAYAGVPVSDLIARMGYYTQDYRDLYEAEYHIGESAYDNVEEYKRRSPAWQAHKFDNSLPLLIHTNTNDEDVNVLEVEHLIKALKAEDKKFEYEIYEDVPGGHSFDRMDTHRGKEIRVKVYKFLAKTLNPPHPINSVDDINRAAYYVK